MSSAFTPGAYIQENFRLDLFMEENIMRYDQTAPRGPVWSLSILLEYSLPNNKIRGD